MALGTVERQSSRGWSHFQIALQQKLPPKTQLRRTGWSNEVVPELARGDTLSTLELLAQRASLFDTGGVRQ